MLFLIPLVARRQVERLMFRQEYSRTGRLVDPAHRQVPLRKGNLYSRQPEFPINLLVQVTYYLQPLIRIPDLEAPLKIEGTLFEAPE